MAASQAPDSLPTRAHQRVLSRPRKGFEKVWLLSAVVIFAAALFGAIYWSRTSLLAVGLIGFILPAFTRGLRNHLDIAVSAIVGAVVSVLCLYFGLGSCGLPFSSPIQIGTLSVPYHCDLQVRDGNIVAHELIVFDQDSLTALFHSVQSHVPSFKEADVTEILSESSAEGWQESGLIDGYRAYVRDRNVESSRKSIGVNYASLLLDLGLLDLPQVPVVEPSGPRTSSIPSLGYILQLIPRPDSRVDIAAPKGSIAATFPPSRDVADTLDDQREAASVPVDQFSDHVAIDILVSELRNPAGKAVYQIFAWGPLPWLIGAVTTFIGAALRNKLGGWLGSLLRPSKRREVKAGPQVQDAL
jgi:hypothetical protein